MSETYQSMYSCQNAPCGGSDCITNGSCTDVKPLPPTVSPTRSRSCPKCPGNGCNGTGGSCVPTGNAYCAKCSDPVNTTVTCTDGTKITISCSNCNQSGSQCGGCYSSCAICESVHGRGNCSETTKYHPLCEAFETCCCYNLDTPSTSGSTSPTASSSDTPSTSPSPTASSSATPSTSPSPTPTDSCDCDNTGTCSYLLSDCEAICDAYEANGYTCNCSAKPHPNPKCNMMCNCANPIPPTPSPSASPTRSCKCPPEGCCTDSGAAYSNCAGRCAGSGGCCSVSSSSETRDCYDNTGKKCGSATCFKASTSGEGEFKASVCVNVGGRIRVVPNVCTAGGAPPAGCPSGTYGASSGGSSSCGC